MPGAPAPSPFFRGARPSGASVTLWNEDCRTGLPRRLPRKGVDVVVTSPPYNLGVPYGTYEDRQPRRAYLRWMGSVADAVGVVLADRGSFFLNLAGPPSDPWLPWDVARKVGERFTLQNVVHWIKSIAIAKAHAGRAAGLTGDIAVGHYKPVNSDRYLHGAHEYVFHFTRHGTVPLDRLAVGVPYQDASNVGRWEGASHGLRCRGNTWFLPYPTIRYRARDRPHPATFPPELPDWCLRLHGLPRVRLAVDPFLGIGASAVAAARRDVPFVGFDVDGVYLSEARDRLAAEGVAAIPAEPAPPAAAPRTARSSRSGSGRRRTPR